MQWSKIGIFQAFAFLVIASTIGSLFAQSPTPTVAERLVAEAIEELSSDIFSRRQLAFGKLVSEGSAAIAEVESSALSGDLDHAERCVDILGIIARQSESRESALQALDRLGDNDSFRGAEPAKKLAADLRETKRERAIRMLLAAGIRLPRSRNDAEVRFVSGIYSDRLCVHLQHLPQVSSVTLSGPGVTNRCFDSLAKIPMLRSLGIVRCSVTDTGLAGLSRLTNLNQVSLSGDFSAVGLRHLRKVTNLRSVSMFSPIGVDELRVVDELSVQSIYLSEVRMSEEASEILSKIDGVRSLHIGIKQVVDGDLAWLEHTPLKSISLSIEDSPQLTDEGLQHLRGKNLRSLRLNKIGMSDEGLASIAEIESLGSLSIYSAPITNDGLRHLTKLQGLRTLSLMNTKVTDTGLLKLKEQIPTLKYVRNNNAAIAKPVPAKKR